MLLAITVAGAVSSICAEGVASASVLIETPERTLNVIHW